MKLKQAAAMILAVLMLAGVCSCTPQAGAPAGAETPPPGSGETTTPAAAGPAAPAGTEMLPSGSGETNAPDASEPVIPDGTETYFPGCSEDVVIRDGCAFVEDGTEFIMFCGEYDVVVLPVSVNSIRLSSKMRTVFYLGTPEQFKTIECFEGDSIAWADRAFMGYANGGGIIDGVYEYHGDFGFQPTPVYYYSETEPAERGMYWHYNEAEFPVLWENNLEFDPVSTLPVSENIFLRGRYAFIKDGVEQIESEEYLCCASVYDGIVIPSSVKSIYLYDGGNAVFYQGTPEQFQKIRCYTERYVAWADRAFTGYANRKGDIDGEYEYIGRNGFHQTPVYYYSETKPALEGMYWYYDANGIPVVWE